MTRHIAKIVFVLLIVIGASATANDALAQMDIVRQIVIEGTMRIEEDAVLNRLVTFEGSRYNEDDINTDIRKIYETGYFYDVQVDVKDTPQGKIITYILEEKPSVKEFVFEGNDEIDNDKINENVDLKPNTILSIAKIKNAINTIRGMYQNEGYFMVDIDYELEDLPNNRVRVIIRVTEYKKVYIKQISFMGNRAFSDERLKKAIMSKEGSFYSFMTSSGIYRKDMFLNDIQMLKSFYMDHGYVQIQVSPPVVSMSADKRWMFISVAVDEGPQFYVRNLDLKGDLLFDKKDLMKLVRDGYQNDSTSKIKQKYDEFRKKNQNLGIKPGDVFSRSKLNNAIENLRNKYTDIGYAFAQVNTNTPTDPNKRTIDIIFSVDRGQLAYFEEINLVGNTRTRDKVIRRELVVKEGDLYSGPGIRKSKARLMRLGYFDEVKITTDKGSNSESVILTIAVTERQQGSFMVGVGFSSLENFVGTAQVSHNNMFGYGTRVSLQAEIGSYRTNVSASVRQPYLLDTKWIGSTSFAYSDRDYYDFERLDKSISASLGRPLYWYFEAHLGFSFQEVETKNVASQAALFLILQEGSVKTTSTFFTLSRNTVNHPFDPTDGSKLSGTVELASDQFGGDLNFIKYTGLARRYFPIYWGIAIMLNGEIGYVDNMDPGRLAISERYFMGGLNSVRGFYARTLGPQEETIIPNDYNDPTSTLTEISSTIGGNKFLQGNVELLIPLVKELQIKGVIFYDAGNAFLEEEEIDLYELRQAWGFGIRWISPMGPLRFEWGYPLYKRDDEPNQVFEFGIGTFF